MHQGLYVLGHHPCGKTESTAHPVCLYRFMDGCIYVSVYEGVSMDLWTNILACYVCLHSCVLHSAFLHIGVYICTRVHVYICIRRHAYVHMRTCVHQCAHIGVYTYTYMYIFAHARMHICTHVYEYTCFA